MKRLSPRYINRLIVGLLMFAPVVYLFGVVLAYLVGAHGVADSTDLADLLSNMFGQSNWLSDMGHDCLDASTRVGFAPFGQLFEYLDDNVLHMSNSNIGCMAYGYMYWGAHVLMFDLVFYVLVFFIRLIKDVLDKLEVSL